MANLIVVKERNAKNGRTKIDLHISNIKQEILDTKPIFLKYSLHKRNSKKYMFLSTPS